MISGRIRNRKAIIELEESGPGRPPLQIEAVIDTGEVDPMRFQTIWSRRCSFRLQAIDAECSLTAA